MSKPKKDSVVKPSMHFEGDKEHVLTTLLEEGDAPVLKSVGYTRLKTVKGQSSYVSYVITTQGEKVLKIDVEEPTQRYIAEEATKIAFVNHFMSEF